MINDTLNGNYDPDLLRVVRDHIVRARDEMERASKKLPELAVKFFWREAITCALLGVSDITEALGGLAVYMEAEFSKQKPKKKSKEEKSSKKKKKEKRKNIESLQPSFHLLPGTCPAYHKHASRMKPKVRPKVALLRRHAFKEE